MASPKRTSGRKRVRKPVDPAILEQRRFTRAVRTLFANMGFIHIPTEGKEAKFGNKTGELDSVFLYENVILIVEDTCSKKPFDHAKNKKILAEQILSSTEEFLKWLAATFPDHAPALGAYSPRRFNVFYLYISRVDMDLDPDDTALLKPMMVVSPRAFNYFDKLAKTIRRSAKTDLWRFLKLGSGDIGRVDASNSAKTIEAAIISPDDSTGFSNGVRLVSFMISAEVLLRNSYVLRKDNWGFSTDLYQRLIDAGRIKKIRQYVAKDGSAFLNNIIVGLPRDVTFQTADGAPIPLDRVQDFSAHRMTIPDAFNSLCIIDGQHRVFAHYEGSDELESKVAIIREKVHLLATGIIFPPEMDELERLRLQSEVFLEINSNSKPVPADVLLAIQSLREPYADVAIARRVLEFLNKGSTFRNMFQLSQMDEAPIKIASIVKFALRYLVDIASDEGLFSEWVKEDRGRIALRTERNSELLAAYANYCATVLNQYFGALKSAHSAEWGDPDSKITSTTVINAMIIALRRSLPVMGLQGFEQYQAMTKAWDVDFSKANFPFSSSQYARFSQIVLRDMYGLIEEDGVWRSP
ncbi:DGQHR domain-containing protein [Cellulosimicrobium cellulans]|uniref:DGQHR domain-containing protein n=1 Tax=Cellulosimicrobium cellulans TaxID=1710 RepID=UPI0024067F7A|nr:DGQHR domain-containing protein [Cellulosimicrobium cellulans]MDF9874747.1 DGQHR domain-containing protein [Cellulosimicrobium cellulans]